MKFIYYFCGECLLYCKMSSYWQCFFVLMKVRKEKSIYHHLNMLSLDVTKKCLVAEGWSPIFASKQVSFTYKKISLQYDESSFTQFELKGLNYDIQTKYVIGFLCLNWFVQIQDALQRAAFDSNSQVGAIFQVLHTQEAPPTYFRTNKFTSSFQEIVEAYGWVPLQYLAIQCFFIDNCKS